MHIAFITHSLAGGGAERIILRLSSGLAARGHKVDIVQIGRVRGISLAIAYPQEIPAAARLFVLCGQEQWKRWLDAGIPETALWLNERPSLGGLAWRLLGFAIRESLRGRVLLLRRYILMHRAVEYIWAGRMLYYMERERPNIVFANLRIAEDATLLAARLMDDSPPVVPVMHCATNMIGSGSIAAQLLLLPEVVHAVAVSKGLANNITEVYGVPSARITVIYNPAFTPDIARLANAAPDHPWLLDGGPPVILGVGRFKLQKDFPTLLEAFRRVLAVRPCRLVILGKGPLHSELEAQVRTLDLENSVSLPGWRENPYAFMSRAALFASSSLSEGLPTVLVEALACGCPAVATDCPSGPAEVLDDPELLAPVGDPEALARVMLRALNRPVDKAALRAKAARFSMKRAIDGYERVIAEVCRNGSSPQGL